MHDILSRGTLCVLALLVGNVAPRAAAEVRVDHVMDVDPEVRLPPIRHLFDARLVGLWRQALERPESELQRLAADSIAIGQRRGVPELRAAAAELARRVQVPETDASVRRAAAHALVVLDAREHAAVLADAARRAGLDLELIVEPALARWGNDSFRPVWRERVQDPKTPPRLRMLAIAGLAALRDSPSLSALLEIVRDQRATAEQRLAAARAAATVSERELGPDADPLLADASSAGMVNRLAGVYLLAAHAGQGSLRRLAALAADPEPAVAAAALAQILAVDPPSAFPLAPGAVMSSDVNLRRLGAQALLARADTAGVESVAALLADPNPSLRRFVTQGLLDLSRQPELKEPVVRVLEGQLRQEAWRGREQAALLAGALPHPPAADRLIELLGHPREEVAVSAAWALRKLKLPATLPAILEHARRQQERFAASETPAHEIPVIAEQLTQLFQIFGEMRYAEADPLLRLFIPKRPGQAAPRSAACWALGKIHEGQTKDDLVQSLAQRLSDLDLLIREDDEVRYMCAIGLGRVHGKAGLETLRLFAADGSDRISRGCWWSIERLTGEKPPEWTPPPQMIVGWFLEPLDR